MVHHSEHRAAGAGFWIGGGIDQSRNTCVEDRAGAHGARLQRNVERAACVGVPVFRTAEEAVILQRAAGLAQRDDLGVGRGVVVAQHTVLPAADDLAIAHNDRADGHFAGSLRGASFRYRGLHVMNIRPHAGSCWERQCSVPRPQTRSTAWMPTTSRLGKQPAMMFSAWRSLASLNVGTSTRPFAM